jgi:signal transduction histidine kinase
MAGGLRFNSVTLKWRAALLFGGQLILVGGGVLAMLLLQQVQYAAGASADSARRTQVLEASYFAEMTEAESGLQEYLETGDPSNLTAYRDGLAQAAASKSALRLIQGDSTEQSLRDQMFARAEAWQGYASGALNPNPYEANATIVGDDYFAAYVDAQQASSAYLETLVAKAAAAQAQSASMELLALAALGTIALITVIAGGVLVYRSTLQPMGRLIRAARELAAGGRTELAPLISAGEIGDLSRALHAWQRSSEKRQAVAEAMHEVSGKVDRDEIVRMSLERLLEVSEGAEVAVMLVGDTGTMVTTMTADKSLQLPLLLPPGSPLDAVLKAGGSVIGDLGEEAWPEELRAWASRRGHGPIAVVPLVSGSTTVGAIGAARAAGSPAFDAIDIGLVEAIASPLAAAIRVAGLFEKVRAVSAQLDLVNQHKTDFLSSMSHELRTPLNSILGFADLLVTPGFDAVTAKQARYIANIRASGTHLASLINDALDLAKVESGKVELELERIDVAGLVAEVLAAMQPLATAAQVKLVTAAGRQGSILADKRKLHQVLLNLLSNAIKFTPVDGCVTVVVQRTDDELQLTVIDTGIGVAGEDQERIFGAFEQVAGANRDGGGTGLGLALSRRYVELHGGRLWLESGIGQGSSFHVNLPIATGGITGSEPSTVNANADRSAKMSTKGDTSKHSGGKTSAGSRQSRLAHAGRGAAAPGREP